MRAEVSNPEGIVSYYTQVTDAPAGQVTMELQLAWNDLPGSWQVTLTDVVTGISAQTNFNVTVPDDADGGPKVRRPAGG